MQVSCDSLNAWFESRTRREQWLFVGVVLVILYQVFTLFLLDVQFARLDAAKQQFANAGREAQTLSAELTSVMERVGENPNDQLNKRIARETQVLNQRRKQVEILAQDLISPRDMVGVLEQMLNNPRLRIDKVTTLGSKPLGKQASGQAASAQVYRHDFVIEIRGGYLDALAYLELVEGLPQQFFWKSVTYQVDKYPEGVMRIELYTLSLSQDWIGV